MLTQQKLFLALLDRKCNFDNLLILQTWLHKDVLLVSSISLQWHHNGCDDVSNHQPHDCLLNCLFRCIWKKTSKLRITGLCAGNSPVTGKFPAQMASNAENFSIWWRHYIFHWSFYFFIGCGLRNSKYHRTWLYVIKQKIEVIRTYYGLYVCDTTIESINLQLLRSMFQHCEKLLIYLFC